MIFLFYLKKFLLQSQKDKMNKIEIVKSEVSKILWREKSGHDYLHVFRVYNMAMQFCITESDADKDIVGFAALLHDCDDLKIFTPSEDKFPNANRIMDLANIDHVTRTYIIDIIDTISFSKTLSGIHPQNINGWIVSDADKCDAIGSTGIIRVIQFGTSKNRAIWDPKIAPIAQDDKSYYQYDKSTTINHFFEKLLLVKNLMFANAGRREAELRHKMMVDFLRQFFIENNALEWIKMLDNLKA